MTFPSIENLRTIAISKIANLKTAILGGNAAQIETARNELVRAYADHGIEVCHTRDNNRLVPTSDFYHDYPRFDRLQLCQLHRALKGTEMFEMLCMPDLPYNFTQCAGSTAPVIDGGLLIKYAVHSDGSPTRIGIKKFIGSYIVNGGEPVVHDTIVDLNELVLPDSGDGTATIEFIGEISAWYQHFQVTERDVIDVMRWGVKCVIKIYAEMFTRCHRTDFKVSALDSPKFGGEYGTSTHLMFHDCTHFNSDISHWDMCAVTDMNSMFQLAKAFNQPIGNWDTRSVISFRHVFYAALAFDQPINWDVSIGEVFDRMMMKASSYSHDMSHLIAPANASRVEFADDTSMLESEYIQFIG